MQTTSKIALAAVGLATTFLVVSEWKKGDMPIISAPMADEMTVPKTTDVPTKQVANQVIATKIPPESWRGVPRAITQADQDNAILWRCLSFPEKIKGGTEDGALDIKKLRRCVDISLGGSEDSLNRDVMDMACDYLKNTTSSNPAIGAAYTEQRVACYSSRNWSNISAGLRAKVDDDVRNFFILAAQANKSYENLSKRLERIHASEGGNVKAPRESALKNRLP